MTMTTIVFTTRVILRNDISSDNNDNDYTENVENNIGLFSVIFSFLLFVVGCLFVGCLLLLALTTHWVV